MSFNDHRKKSRTTSYFDCKLGLLVDNIISSQTYWSQRSDNIQNNFWSFQEDGMPQTNMTPDIWGV